MSANLLCGVAAFLVIAAVLGVCFYRALWGAGLDQPRDQQ